LVVGQILVGSYIALQNEIIVKLNAILFSPKHISMTSYNIDEEMQTPLFPFDEAIHYNTKIPNDEEKHALTDLRFKLKNDSGELYHRHQIFCSDSQLMRFLIARRFNVDEAFKAMMAAFLWRSSRNPDEIEFAAGWDEKISHEAETGKICKDMTF
jgi:hypothetical protein